MRTIHVLLLLTATLWLNSCTAFAETVDLDRIVVTPSRIEQEEGSTPYNVEVVTGGEVRQAYPEDISTALETASASVNVNDYGSLGATKTIRVRGTSASQVLVMMDGRPLNSPRDGEVDLSTIPLSDVGRIEVVHGPGSSLYGSPAVGGIVNIISREPPRETQTEITSLAGSYRAFIERLSHGSTLGKFGYLVTGEFQDSEGNRTNSEYQSSNASGKFNYQVNDENKLSLHAGTFKSNAGTPGRVTMEDKDDTQTQLKRFIDAGWRYEPDEKLSFSVRGYRNYDRLQYFENSAGSMWDTAGRRSIHTTVVDGFDSQVTGKLTDIYTATAGFSYTRDYNKSNESGIHDYNVRAGYIENILEIGKLQVNGGLRLDDYSNFGTEINPNAGIVYTFAPGDRLRAAASRSFRAPTFNDLYWPDDGWNWGNPNLKPEVGINVEAGFDKRIFSGLDVSATVFRNRLSDLIVWAPTDETNMFWTPSNVESAEITGLELGSRLRIIDDLSLTLSYTLLDARNRQTKKELVYRARNRANARLRYAGKGLTSELWLDYTGSRYGDTGNLLKLKPYYTLNFSLDKAITPNVNLLLTVNNLLDRKYETVSGYPAPGFSTLAGIKVKF